MNVKEIVKWCFSFILGFHPKYRHKIVLFMDGGICSQMKVYVIGRLFEERGDDVYYDISAIENGGKDCDNVFARNFDLLKLYPTINFKKIESVQRGFWVKYLKFSHRYAADFKYLDIMAPRYMAGYYEMPDSVYKSIKKYFPQPANIESKYVDKISNCKYSCGVHVRRGDLKYGNPFYGAAASPQYFINAIDVIHKSYPTVKFFFFSDELEYVKKEILPYCADIEYECVEGNGSDRGYVDLYLLMMCNFQISSCGSFGKFAALFNEKEPRALVLMDTPESKLWKGRFDGKVIIVNDTE